MCEHLGFERVLETLKTLSSTQATKPPPVRFVFELCSVVLHLWCGISWCVRRAFHQDATSPAVAQTCRTIDTFVFDDFHRVCDEVFFTVSSHPACNHCCASQSPAQRRGYPSATGISTLSCEVEGMRFACPSWSRTVYNAVRRYHRDTMWMQSVLSEHCARSPRHSTQYQLPREHLQFDHTSAYMLSSVPPPSSQSEMR